MTTIGKLQLMALDMKVTEADLIIRKHRKEKNSYTKWKEKREETKKIAACAGIVMGITIIAAILSKSKKRAITKDVEPRSEEEQAYEAWCSEVDEDVYTDLASEIVDAVCNRDLESFCLSRVYDPEEDNEYPHHFKVVDVKITDYVGD